MKKPGIGSPLERFTRLMFTHIIGRVSAFLAQNPFSISEIAALHWVSQSESLSVQALSAHLKLSISATSRLVSGLVKKGYFTMKQNPEDGRGKIISCTKKGSEFLDQMSLERVSAIFDLLPSLPPAIPKQILKAVAFFGKE